MDIQIISAVKPCEDAKTALLPSTRWHPHPPPVPQAKEPEGAKQRQTDNLLYGFSKHQNILHSFSGLNVGNSAGF